MNDNKIVFSEINKIKSDDSMVESVQSANSLLHFMKERWMLVNKIRDKALIPRYTGESIGYLGIDINVIYYPMLCFCDINLHKIEPHLGRYGSYGIAFSKEWSVKKGIEPINYINNKSEFANDFREAFSYGSTLEENNILKDFLLSTMCFMKPLQGKNICHGEEEVINFTDECEWRFIPKSEHLPAAVVDWNSHFSKDDLNTALEKDDSLWLKFDYRDIRYIILPNWDEIKGFLTDIKMLGLSEEEQLTLCTKCICWDDFKGDV